MIRNKSRTWNTVTTDRECGVVVGHTRNTVTISADSAGQITATLDGQPCDVLRADQILRHASTRTLVCERRAPIGSSHLSWAS